MDDVTLQSEGLAGRYEELAGHSRLRRAGNVIAIGGTAAIDTDGTLHAPGDTYAQTVFILRRFQRLLERAGADLTHVIRTRAHLSDMGAAAGFSQAHKEFFDTIRPCTTAVGVTLWEPGMMIEMELDAVVTGSPPTGDLLDQ